MNNIYIRAERAGTRTQITSHLEKWNLREKVNESFIKKPPSNQDMRTIPADDDAIFNTPDSIILRTSQRLPISLICLKILQFRDLRALKKGLYDRANMLVIFTENTMLRRQKCPQFIMYSKKTHNEKQAPFATQFRIFNQKQEI